MPSVTDAASLIGQTTEHLRANLSSLSPAEKRIAEAVLRDPVDVIHLSVTELAKIADASASTVVRMCSSLGLRGFQELKILLAQESIPAERQMLAAILPEDTSAEAARKVIAGTATALERAAAVVDVEEIASVAESIREARQVLFGAVGTSSPIAADATQRLVTIGIDARFIQDVHGQHIAARMMQPDDVFIAISHTGSTTETLAAASAAREAGATVLALTSFATSPLTGIAHRSIIAGSAETSYRVEAMVSRVVHLTIIDAIYVALSLRNEKATEYQKLAADVIIAHRI